MVEKKNVIPVGALFVLTVRDLGEHLTLGVCKALKEIDTEAVQEEYLVEHSERSMDNFIQAFYMTHWMLGHGYAEKMGVFDFRINLQSPSSGEKGDGDE